MIVYLGIYLLLAALALTVDERRERPVLIGAAAFLSVFAGLRIDVGCDYTGYANRFENDLTEKVAAGPIRTDEWLFDWLMHQVQTLGGSYTTFLLIVSVIIISCYVFFASRFRESILLVALFFPILVVQLAMSGVRQGLATGVLMLAFLAYARQRRLLFVALVLAAAGFHTSVVVFLPLVFLIGRDLSPARVVIGAILAVPIIAFFLGDRMDLYSDRYVEQIYGEQESSGGIVRYFVALLPALPLFALLREVRARHRVLYPFLLVSALIILACLPSLFISTVALHRFTYYVLPLSAVIAVYWISVLDGERTRKFARLALVGFYGFYSLAWLLTSSHAARCYIPYQNAVFG